MKKPFLLAGLFLLLTGCPSPPPAPPLNNAVEVDPNATPTPTPWLSIDPVCTGAITRAEWLVCDNPNLNWLHRRLAEQWATARQSASPERMDVLQDQLYALLSERDQCQDAACVATAYRRYLDGAAPPPPPSGHPVPPPPPKKWVRPAPPKRWRHHSGRGEVWERAPRDDDDGPSCAGTAGGTEATRLARQCDRVTTGADRSCAVTLSCSTLRRNIVKGCNETYRKPDFCPRL